jgi:hypothetical protein
LARLSGAEFDRQFAAEMVKRRQVEIAKYEKQAESGDSKVSELAEDLLPTCGNIWRRLSGCSPPTT